MRQRGGQEENFVRRSNKSNIWKSRRCYEATRVNFYIELIPCTFLAALEAPALPQGAITAGAVKDSTESSVLT